MSNPDHIRIVLAGPDAVTEWRDAHPSESFDLRGAVLSNRLLARFNLAQSDFRDADLSESIFEKSNLSQAQLDRTKLAGSDFLNADVIGASLDDADLTGAKLDNAKFYDCKFRRAKLVGASLWHAILQGSTLAQANLERAKLYQADLSNCDLRSVNFDLCVMENTNLGGSNLRGARNLSSIRHLTESIVDFRTAALSGPLPIDFLRGSGVPEQYLEIAANPSADLTVEEVRAAMARGEGQTIEFKSGFGETNDAIRTLNAFIHAEGGTVYFGIAKDLLVGVTLGANTSETFANQVRGHTDPLLPVRLLSVTIDGKSVVAARVSKAYPGQLFHAFSRAWIRIGAANHPMSAEEQRARLRVADVLYSEERDRPRFAVRIFSLASAEPFFRPHFSVRHATGDHVANIGWRIRGPRFAMPWRQSTDTMLEVTQFTSTFDLTQIVSQDAELEADEMGFELRFHWRDRVAYELHKWRLTRKEAASGAEWTPGDEIEPPFYS